MHLKNVALKVLEDKSIREWFEAEFDTNIYEDIKESTPQEIRTSGLDAIGEIVDLILDSGLDAEIITEEEIENAE